MCYFRLLENSLDLNLPTRLEASNPGTLLHSTTGSKQCKCVLRLRWLLLWGIRMNIQNPEFSALPRRREAPRDGPRALLRTVAICVDIQCCSRDLFAFAVQGPAEAVDFCHGWPGMCMIYVFFFLTQGFVIKEH